MQRSAFVCTIFAACFSLQAAAESNEKVASAQVHPGGADWALLKDYCTECHNTVDWAGGVAFDTLTPDTIVDDAEVWEGAIRKLRGRLMPPPGNPQPGQQRIDDFVGWMEGTLNAATTQPRAGHVPVQRLNRTEYANAVRGLLGVEINAKELLPQEVEVDGFDNIAAALSVSPAFLDQYIGAARTVARLAVGDSAPKVANVFHAAPGGAQDTYVDGMPLGSRGGMVFRHNFPADGEYRFNVLDLDVGLYPWAAETRHTLVVLVAGNEVFRGDVGGPEDLATVDREGAAGRKKIMDRFANIPAKVKAGAHDVVVTFVERAQAESDEYVNDSGGFGGGGFGRLRVPRLLDGIQVVGPFNVTGLSQTASRQKLFVCEPTSADEELACARRITENLARRAYRRPVDQADIASLLPFYEAGRKDGGNFDSGIRQVVTAVLSSPDFLYRAILPSKKAPDAPFHALSDLELASRLAFFLWSQGPDDELIGIAAAGKLGDPEVMQAQVRRMLADPRAGTLVTSFAVKWLNVDELEAVDPDPRLFPAYTPALRQDFSREMELFLKSVLLEEQNVTALLTSNQTFLNERLARHYDITSVRGPQFRRVTLTDEARWGLLGKGAVLLRTSYGDRTSPVLRGAWVLEKLMGTPPTPPPPDVVTDLSTPVGEKPKTMRARLERHRLATNCNQCHGVIDPMGLALENFDATGQWRVVDRQAREPIDASTILPNGASVNGPAQLRDQLLRKPEQFVQALTEKLVMYGLGRELEYHDMPQIRAIVSAAKQDDYKLSAIVLGIVKSDAFRMQSLPHEGKKVETKTAAVSAPGNAAKP